MNNIPFWLQAILKAATEVSFWNSTIDIRIPSNCINFSNHPLGITEVLVFVDPEKQMFSFNGWFEEEGDTAFNSDPPPTTPIGTYAEFIAAFDRFVAEVEAIRSETEEENDNG